MINTLAGFAAFVLLASLCCLVAVSLLARFVPCRSGTSPSRSVLRSIWRWQWLLSVLVMTDAFVLANHLVFRGLAVGIWDADRAYHPYHTLVADHAAAARFLHWDPWSEGGMPAGGDPQFGAFSPLTLVIGLIAGGSGRSFLAYWMLVWWLGGLGMLMLARHLKASPFGGAIVAVGFLFCGTYIGHAEHTSVVYAYSLLPFLIWRLDVALASGQLRAALEAGALWGLSGLAGYPGIVIGSGMFAALWVLGRWLFWPATEGTRPTLRLAFSSLLLVPLIGVLVLAPTYFAYFYEGAGTSSRVGALRREVAIAGNALAPGAIATLASPFLVIVKVMSNTGSGQELWKDTDVSGCGLYTGVAITILAIFALLHAPRDKWRWWIFGVAILFLGFALGPALPLRGWLYDLVFPTRYFRHPTIFRVYFVFGLSLLALMGSGDLSKAIGQAGRAIWKELALTATICAGSALVVFYYYALSGAVPRIPREGDSLGTWHAFVLWVGVTLVVVFAWLSPRVTRHWLFLMGLLTLSIADAVFTTSVSVGVYADASSASVKRWEELDRRHSTSVDLTKRGLAREESSAYQDDSLRLDLTNDQMITKVPSFRTYTTAINKFQWLMSRHLQLKKMALGAERFWFASEVRQLAPTLGNYNAFESLVEKGAEFPIVVHTRSDMFGRQDNSEERGPDLTSLPDAEPLPVLVSTYSSDELSFSVRCNTDGWLLVTDRWGPNWRATVNDVPVGIFGGNFIFRAIRVTAGENRVRFTYETPGVLWLVGLSWLTLAVIGGSALVKAFQSGRAAAGSNASASSQSATEEEQV